MPNSYTCNRLHCVFATKNRALTFDSQLQPRLWSYIAGIARNLGMEVISVGGHADHVHMFIGLPAKLTLAEAMQKVKANSSRWLNHEIKLKDFSWQEGYGAFSVSLSRTAATFRYIAAQTDHHRTRDFNTEFRKMLAMHGITLSS